MGGRSGGWAPDAQLGVQCPLRFRWASNRMARTQPVGRPGPDGRRYPRGEHDALRLTDWYTHRRAGVAL